MKYYKKKEDELAVPVMPNSIIRKDMPDKWLEPYNYKQKQRLLEILKMQYHMPSSCPECEHELVYGEDCEVYCSHCGLVVCDSYSYVAGIKINYPFGLRLG